MSWFYLAMPPRSRCTTDIEAGTPIPTAGTRTTRSGMRRSMRSLIGADDVDAVRDLLRRLCVRMRAANGRLMDGNCQRTLGQAWLTVGGFNPRGFRPPTDRVCPGRGRGKAGNVRCWARLPH